MRREVWVDHLGRVTRYNLAYINQNVFQKDNGRAVGYDNAHGKHHRHYMGTTETIIFTTFDDIEERFPAGLDCTVGRGNENVDH